MVVVFLVGEPLDVPLTQMIGQDVLRLFTLHNNGLPPCWGQEKRPAQDSLGGPTRDHTSLLPMMSPAMPFSRSTFSAGVSFKPSFAFPTKWTGLNTRKNART